MTISEFHRDYRAYDGTWAHLGTVRQQYREQKRLEAEERQEAFDAEVVRAARDHNISDREARRVVRERNRFEYRRSHR
jgi:hypothetical protein